MEEGQTKPVIKEASGKMKKALDHLINELSKLRAGKASTQMLDGIYVEYYGASVPLNQVSTIHTPNHKTITIQPWEKSMIEPVEKAIMGANIGLNPQNDGNVIHINIPALTEERRKELVKFTRNEGEQSKISIRNVRKEANEKIKSLQNKGLSEDEAQLAEEKIQDMTDNYGQKIDEALKKKEEEIMTV